MNDLITLRSKQDNSVNFVRNVGSGQAFEYRYVRRSDDYFIAYISSQSACSQGCKMCHLTSTGQTVPTNATFLDMTMQASTIVDYHLDLKRKAERKNFDNIHSNTKNVNFNFMARGEPLLNPQVDDKLLHDIGVKAIANGLRPGFLVSTIMPLKMKQDLRHRFALVQPEICYSIYSVDPQFRKKWLPAAMPVAEALDRLNEWQYFSGKLVKIHYALIKNENDHDHVFHVAQTVKKSGLRVNVNLVQYNPPDDNSEPALEPAYEIAKIVFKSILPEATVKIVPKVGYDVKASCGMFVER